MHAAYIGSAAAAIELSVLGNHPVGIDRLREWLGARHELQPDVAAQRQKPVSV